MINIIPPIRLNDQGKQVKNLHFTLFLCLQKSKNRNLTIVLETKQFTEIFKIEAHDQVYGVMTSAVVKLFQENPEIPAENIVANGEIDKPTAEMFNKLLLQYKGLEMKVPPNYPFDTADPPVNPPQGKIFKVSGHIMNSFNEPIPGQKLFAYDLDLIGAVYYKKIDSVNGQWFGAGMQKLGEVVSDHDGYYEINFTEKDFAEAEEELADVVVFAISDNGFIVGRSSLSTKKDYTDEFALNNWNVLIVGVGVRGETEYSRLMKIVKPFIAKSKVNLFEIAGSEDQIEFLSMELGQDRLHLSILANADRLSHESGGNEPSNELLYGIGRQRIRLDWNALAITRIEILQNAIRESIKQNIISLIGEDLITAFLARIHAKAHLHFVSEQDATKNAGINKFLAISIKDPQLQSEFIKLSIHHDESSGSIWKKLSSIPAFTQNPDTIPALQLSTQLSLLTNNHFALVNELQVNRKIKEPKDLLALSRNNWKEIIENTGLPIEVKEEEREAFKEQYITEIQNQLNSSFPTKRIAMMVSKQELQHRDETINQAVLAFFDKAVDFDFASSRVHNYDVIINEVSAGKQAELKSYLQMLQRVFQLSPVPEAMPKLINRGLLSAYQVAAIPLQNFLATYKEEFGEDVARDIHTRAGFIAARSQTILLQLHEATNSLTPAAVMDTKQRDRVVEEIKKNIPDYEQFFR